MRLWLRYALVFISLAHWQGVLTTQQIQEPNTVTPGKLYDVSFHEETEPATTSFVPTTGPPLDAPTSSKTSSIVHQKLSTEQSDRRWPSIPRWGVSHPPGNGLGVAVVMSFGTPSGPVHATSSSMPEDGDTDNYTTTSQPNVAKPVASSVIVAEWEVAFPSASVARTPPVEETTESMSNVSVSSATDTAASTVGEAERVELSLVPQDDEEDPNTTLAVSSVLLSASEVQVEEAPGPRPKSRDPVLSTTPNLDLHGGIYPDDVATGEYDSYESDEEAPVPEYVSWGNISSFRRDRLSANPSRSINVSSVDLHERDVFDSVMYIYLGAGGGSGSEAGRMAVSRAILGVSGCLALAAQTLTLTGAACMVRADRLEPTLVLFNIVMALLAGNLVFTFGVQATSEPETCEAVALVLHYLDLVTSFWLLSHGIHTYLTLRQHTKRHIRDYCILSWAIPLVFVVVSYVVNPQGYETRRYCWMSVERGMVLSFIVPVFILIVVNTTLILLSLKHLFALRPYTRKSDVSGLRLSLRAGAILLPLFVVCWFFGVIALESTSTVVFHLVFAVTYVLLNWLIFLFFCALNKDVRQVVQKKLCSRWHRDASPAIIVASSRWPEQANRPHCDGERLLTLPPEDLGLWDDLGHDLGAASTPTSLSLPPPSPPPPPPPPPPQRRAWGGNEIYEMRLDCISTISA